MAPQGLRVIAEQDAADDLIPPGVATVRAVRERASIIGAVTATLANPDMRRVVVVAGPELPDAFCAAVVARLMLVERLDVEVALVLPAPTLATKIYELPFGAPAVELAQSGAAVELPLVRDDAAIVLLGRAHQRGVDGDLGGESYVDNDLLYRGRTKGVVIEPLMTMPGVRAKVDRRWRSSWLTGRAVQTGAPQLVVDRDGVPGPRPVKRSTFYRHHVNWKLVRP